ncbi:MAG: calcium/sodium antiporter [Thermoplasmatota archaeon]
MDVLLYVAELAVGLLLLAKGSDVFIDGAASVARATGASEHTIGLTLVAFATSLPEIAVSSIAAFQGEAGIAIGNIVGSNITNICLILGVSALIMPLYASRETRRDSLFMLAVTLLLLGSLVFDGRIDVYDGVLYLAVYGGFVYYWYVTHRREHAVVPEVEPGSMPKNGVLLAAGGIAVIVGARLTVNAGVGFADLLGVPRTVIGLSMVAFGSSLPELASSVAAALKGKHGIAVGNIIGSNIINVLLALGVSGVIRPVAAADTIFLMLPFLLLVSLALTWFARRRMDRRYGAVLLGLYVVFIVLLIL